MRRRLALGDAHDLALQLVALMPGRRNIPADIRATGVRFEQLYIYPHIAAAIKEWNMTRTWRMIAAALLLLGLPLMAACPAQADDVLVFAAASLKNALDDAIAAYGSSDPIKVSYAASSALAKQIEAGAP